MGCRPLPCQLRVLHFTSTSPLSTGIILIAANKLPILHAPATFLTRLLLLRRWLTQSPGLQPNACAAVPPERPTHSCRHAIPPNCITAQLTQVTLARRCLAACCSAASAASVS